MWGKTKEQTRIELEATEQLQALTEAADCGDREGRSKQMSRSSDEVRGQGMPKHPDTGNANCGFDQYFLKFRPRQQGFLNPDLSKPLHWFLYSVILHGLCSFAQCLGRDFCGLAAALSALVPSCPKLTHPEHISAVSRPDVLGRGGFLLVHEESWHGPCKRFVFMVKTEIRRKTLSYFDGLVLMIHHIYICIGFMVVSMLLLHSIVFFSLYWFQIAKSGNEHWQKGKSSSWAW